LTNGQSLGRSSTSWPPRMPTACDRAGRSVLHLPVPGITTSQHLRATRRSSSLKNVIQRPKPPREARVARSPLIGGRDPGCTLMEGGCSRRRNVS